MLLNSQRKKRFSIKVENKDKVQVTIAIKDTGTGINSEILPRLFTKYSTSLE
jgi:signal transduction histidine kinase